MKAFQISNGTIGFTYKDKNYTIADSDTVSYTYSRKNHLTRGANGNNKVGISYKEGMKTPDAAEAKIVDCSVAIYNLLLKIFNDEERINFWFKDNKLAKASLIKTQLLEISRAKQALVKQKIQLVLCLQSKVLM